MHNDRIITAMTMTDHWSNSDKISLQALGFRLQGWAYFTYYAPVLKKIVHGTCERKGPSHWHLAATGTHTVVTRKNTCVCFTMLRIVVTVWLGAVVLEVRLQASGFRDGLILHTCTYVAVSRNGRQIPLDGTVMVRAMWSLSAVKSDGIKLA
jgi:hypothetical protein